MDSFLIITIFIWFELQKMHTDETSFYAISFELYFLKSQVKAARYPKISTSALPSPSIGFSFCIVVFTLSYRKNLIIFCNCSSWRFNSFGLSSGKYSSWNYFVTFPLNTKNIVIVKFVIDNMFEFISIMNAMKSISVSQFFVN